MPVTTDPKSPEAATQQSGEVASVAESGTPRRTQQDAGGRRAPPTPGNQDGDRLRDFKILPLEALHEDPANARKHGPKNLEAIRGSLLEFGQVEPLVIQKSTRKMIGGNGRLGVMRDLGWTEAKVFEVDCDNAQAVALGIALNRSAELAEWDQDALDKLLATVKVDDADFQAMFDDLKTVTPPAIVEDVAPIDRADELQKKWHTATGQLWEIPSKTAPPRKVAICPNCQHKNRVQP